MVFLVVHGPPNLSERLNQLKEVNPGRYEVVKKMVADNLNLQPLNVRTLERIDWTEIGPRVEKTDEGTDGYVISD